MGQKEEENGGKINEARSEKGSRTLLVNMIAEIQRPARKNGGMEFEKMKKEKSELSTKHRIQRMEANMNMGSIKNDDNLKGMKQNRFQ